MGHYHHEVIHVYGTYLFCLYFELFQELIEPNEQEKEAIEELRDHLQRIFRWPEMVTFEEMNLPVPDPDPKVAECPSLQHILHCHERRFYLGGQKNIRNEAEFAKWT